MCDEDNSSSDMGPMFSSPDNSDVEDEENNANNNFVDLHDDYGGTPVNGMPSKPSSISSDKKTIDPFKFQAVSFQKARTTMTSGHVLCSNDSPKDCERSRHNLECKRQAGFLLNKAHKKRKRIDDHDSRIDDGDDDDDDDSSDMEIWGGSCATKQTLSTRFLATNKTNKERPCKNGSFGPQQQEVIELSSDDCSVPGSAAKIATSTSKPTVGVAVTTRLSTSATVSSLNGKRQLPPMEQYSSDDGSEKEACTGSMSSHLIQQQRSVPILPANAADAMKRAREAQSRLAQAQQYHAHDIDVPVMVTEIIHRRPRSAVKSDEKRLSSGMLKDSIDRGIPLQVTCRTQITIKEETKRRTHEVTLTIRDGEVLQTLVDKLFGELALPPSSTLLISFDGIKLDPQRTARSYEMEDGDLIDCTAQASHLLAT
jgi:hypothetical protein